MKTKNEANSHNQSRLVCERMHELVVCWIYGGRQSGRTTKAKSLCDPTSTFWWYAMDSPAPVPCYNGERDVVIDTIDHLGLPAKRLLYYLGATDEQPVFHDWGNERTIPFTPARIFIVSDYPPALYDESIVPFVTDTIEFPGFKTSRFNDDDDE